MSYEIVNPETGEILDESAVDALALSAADVPAVQDFAWRVGRAVATIDNKDATSPIANIDREIERLTEIRHRMSNIIEARRSFLIEKVRAVMEAHAVYKLQLPGVGVFRYRKMPPALDEDFVPFDDIKDEDKKELCEKYPNWFKLAESYKPDKKAILADVKAGNEVPHFKLRAEATKFEFKAE